MANRMSIEGAVQPKVAAGAPKTSIAGAQQYTSPAGQSPSVGMFANRPSYSVADATTGQPFTPERLQQVTQPGYVGGGGGGLAPSVTAPTEEDYLAGDSGYQTQVSALTSALQRYLADSDFQKTNYQTDYNKSVHDLGYDEGAKSWNWDDPLTASGRGYQNQLNDFGARGMLQSSGYADAYNELQRMLGQQYDSISGNKNTFMTDLDNQIANYKGENTSNQQAARAEALQRRASGFAL